MKNHIPHTTPVTKPGLEPKSTEDLPDQVITEVSEFQMKAQAAAITGAEYLIVNDKVYDMLGRGIKTPYLTYGSPGIKVYREGTKEDCDKFDNRRLD